MNTQKYREIGVAGCCGAVAGTAVAIICDWSILMLVPSALIGAVSAFVCYNPREIASTIGAFGRDMGGAMRGAGQNVRCGKVWEIVRQGTFPAACIIIAISSAFLLPMLLTMGGVHLPLESSKGPPMPMWLAMFSEVLVSFGACVVLAFIGFAVHDISERWPMPLTQRLNDRMDHWLGDDWRLLDVTMSRKKILLLCLIGPPLVQVVSGLVAMMFILDVILTILLVCASSERIAAVLGAMLGLCVATLLHVCGVPGSFVGSLVILVASGTVGWYAGPFLYHLRATLAREAAAETVRSS